MATLPTVPSFAFQETPTIAKLNQLSGAVSFVSQMPIVASLKATNGQAITASTNTALTWATKETDSDGMYSSSANTRLTSQTQGYYKMHVVVAASIVSNQDYTVFFRQTTGANNPAGSGHTVVFGGIGTASAGATSDFESLSTSAITPCLYVADYVEVIFFCSTAVTIHGDFEFTGNSDTAGNADGASAWQAYYLFEGP